MWRRLFLFLIITFAWSWSWWGIVILQGGSEGFAHAGLFTPIGAFGPAIGGVVSLRLTSKRRRWGVNRVGFLVGVGVALLAMLLNAFFFSLDRWVHPGRDGHFDPSLYTSPVGIALCGLILLLSGYVFGSWNAPDRTVAAHFKRLKPDAQALVWALPVMLIMPAVLLGGYAIARLLGDTAGVPYALRTPVMDWLPVMLAGLVTVAALTGGNEEHGWRGVMQPALHRRVSPLFAALIILVIWDVWHMPLHVAGVYGADNAEVVAAFLGRLPNMLLISIVLAAIYQATRGSIFLCVLFHACYNTQLSFFASEGTRVYATALGALLAVILIVRFKLWRRDLGFRPAD